MSTDDLADHISLEASGTECAQSDPGRARELLERALRLKEHKFGPEHREMARINVKLGEMLKVLGVADQRKVVLERAVWIQEQHYSYGPEHEVLVSSLASLADAYHDLGETAESQATLERMRKVKEAMAGFPSELRATDYQVNSWASQQLCDVPPEVFSFSSLVALDVSRNRISELPPEIARLRALESLDVSRNRLKFLPAELGELSQLRRVNAFSNQLRQVERSLPHVELAALPHFALLDLRFNPKIKEASVSGLLAQRLPGVTVLLSGAAPSFPQKQYAADRDARLLQSQLEPFSMAQLCERLQEFGETVDAEKVERWWVMDRLLELYAARGPRAVRRVRGTPCNEALLDALLEELRRTEFPGENSRERQKIRAEGYIILSRPTTDGAPESSKAKLAAFKLRTHAKIWDLAARLVAEVDADFASRWTALALTKQFVGSPHIDVDNVGPFYGCALGDFEGGAICVEGSPFEVVEVDTQRRLGKADGRFPHWVAPYTGERYSLIFYQTWGEGVPQTTAVFEQPEEDDACASTAQVT